MRFLTLSLLLLCFSAYAETGYRIVHPDGSVEFTDQPVKGSEEIKLRNAPTTTFVPVTPYKARNTTEQGDAEEDSTKGSITISSPTADQTVWFDEAGMTVQVKVMPALRSGQQVIITLDGSQVAKGAASSFLIKEVYRGSHQLTAAVIDEEGNTLFRSPQVVFHLRQHSSQRP